MKKPNIEDIAKERSSKYKKKVGKLDVDVVDRELGQLAFKDGFEDAVREFVVPDMIEALIHVLECHRSGKGFMVLNIIEEALKKAGVNLNEKAE